MPTLGCHVPEDSPLFAAAQRRAKERHDGKVSAYVRALLERDLSGEGELPDASDEYFLERVIEIVLPGKAARFHSHWSAKQAALTLEERAYATTQGEVATALLESFLFAYSNGRVPADSVPSFRITRFQDMERSTRLRHRRRPCRNTHQASRQRSIRCGRHLRFSHR